MKNLHLKLKWKEERKDKNRTIAYLLSQRERVAEEGVGHQRMSDADEEHVGEDAEEEKEKGETENVRKKGEA